MNVKITALMAGACFLASLVTYSAACSCMAMHPQDHYCNSDFVILARPRRENVSSYTRTFKVRVRKEFKMTEKALVALKSGKLHTPEHDSMCGAYLQMGKLYLIAGNVESLRAHFNICDMVIPWEMVTRRQRKGLRQMYKNGCNCSIFRCYSKRCPKRRNSCGWRNECEEKEGICLKNRNNTCSWRMTQTMRKCLREKSPLTISR